MRNSATPVIDAARYDAQFGLRSFDAVCVQEVSLDCGVNVGDWHRARREVVFQELQRAGAGVFGRRRAA